MIEERRPAARMKERGKYSGNTVISYTIVDITVQTLLKCRFYTL